MSQSPLHAFFLGRAAAEVLRENATHCVTDILSELGKFDAEQREKLRQFTGQVMERAEVAANQVTTNSPSAAPTQDLQATIDELRAEIAKLRSALLNYRQA